MTGVKVIFAHDTECALSGTAALVNTAAGDDEHLPDVAALDDFVRTWGWTGKRDRTEAERRAGRAGFVRTGGWTGKRGRTEAELRAVRALRPRIRKFWELDEDRIVVLVNELLREGRALPQLVKHDGWDYHIHASSPDAPLAVR